MRTKAFLWVSALLLLAVELSAQVTLKIVADNRCGVYTGTATTAGPQVVTCAWPTVATPAPFTPPSTATHLYVVANDDGQKFQGLLATLGVDGGYTTTGTALWTVCPTNGALTTATPTPAQLTARIAACNNTSGWKPTNTGPNDGNSPLAPSFLWPSQPQIDDTASWVWYDRPSAPCTGSINPPFLGGACNPGESLIFRIALQDVRRCQEPIPDFTINWGAGFGTLVANGSNSQWEQNHFWSIQKANQSWIGQGPEVMSWFPGPAGVFDLKAFFEASGQKLECDAYYRVKLAVANSCVTWRDTIKLVKVKCCPGEVACLDLERPVVTNSTSWEVTEVPSGVALPAAPYAVSGTPFFSSTAPNWITAVPNANASALGGFYTYEHRFCLCPGYSNPQLILNVCTDNEAVISLNGNQIGTTGPNGVCVTMAAPPNAFVAGTNVLKARVRNRGVGGVDSQPTATGVSINGTLVAKGGRCSP